MNNFKLEYKYNIYTNIDFGTKKFTQSYKNYNK